MYACVSVSECVECVYPYMMGKSLLYIIVYSYLMHMGWKSENIKSTKNNLRINLS